MGPEVVAGALASYRPAVPHVSLRILAPEDVTPEPASARDLHTPHLDPEKAGRRTADALERAVTLALEGAVDAVVTGPVHKPTLRAIGWRHPGQTEFLRERSGGPEVGMLMAAERTRLGSPLRILLATTHLALRAVPDALSRELFIRQTRLLHRALREDWGIPNPVVGLCAVNPHASDGGLFGREEHELQAPAVERLQAEGLRVEGPIPADTVFARALEGEFHGVVAPYHDVGMAAFKTVAFGHGVNVTLGLPFVRTSPDHGTAFDRAGTGSADPSSMLEALRLAERLAARRGAGAGARPGTA